MTRRRLAASVLCLACWLARPAPARAAEPELLLDDGFETYDTRYWCTQPEGVSLADGILRDAPAQGQRWIASNERFLCADLDLTVKFGTLSRDSSIFYYLGFQSISPWVRDVCWVMVQDSVMIVGLKKAGRDGANQPVANVEAGRWYRLSLRWKPSQVEVYLDDLQVFTSAGLRHELSSASRAAEVIPATPLPVFLSANTTRDQPEKAELFVDRVEVRGVRVRKTPRVASAAESSFLRVDRSLGSPGGTRLDVRRGMLRLENRHLLAELDARAGLAWSRLVHRPSGTGCLYESENLPLFMVLGPDFRLDSTDFSVEEVRLGEEGGRRRMDIALAQTAAGVRARLSAVVGPDEQTLWTLRVTNAARVARRLLVVFPILGRVRVGPSLKETHYFYPWRSGIEGTVDCQHIHEYGNLAWMQVMSAFNPERNAGVTVYPRDLKKVSADSEAFVQHSEAVLQTEMPGGEILDFQEGLGLAYYYVPRTLPAGATWSLPETALSVSPGGWKRALQDYSRWAHTWYRGADTPAWFKDCFNYLPAHPPSYYDRDRKRYTCAEGLRGGEHLFQWAYWDDYADNPADRQAYLKPEVYRPGDFEINRERGGLPPFREEVRRIHAAGARFTLYLDHRFCWSGSNAHASHAKDWAAFYAPGQVGSYRTPDEGVMCYYEPNAWADYVARTCGRLVREAGLDGVYLDELGIAFPCYNSAHQHYQRGDWPVPIPLLARHIRLARAAMRAANPEAILMTEHAGSDWLSQFIDGSWVQTYYRAGFPFAEQFYDHDSLIYFRFCFPEFKLADA
ncbi:MAG: hypothetical protein HYU66_12115, partial [Armatimonadetes bacterium]|nr:hypothetical protein [Armatimonadota bacterium]